MDLMDVLLQGLIQGLPATAIILIVLIVMYYQLRSEISDMRGRLRDEINDVGNQLRGEISSLRDQLGGEISSLRSELGSLRGEFRSFRGVMVEFNSALLELLEVKGLLSHTEVLALRVALRTMRPGSSSKYYTREVEEKLKNLLDKEPEDFTLEDVWELERISNILVKEAAVSGRDELADYAGKLLAYAILVKVKYVFPKLRREEEERRKLKESMARREGTQTTLNP